MDESRVPERPKYQINWRGLAALVGLVGVSAILARVFSPNVGAALFVGFILVMTVVVMTRPREQDLEGLGGPDGAGWIGGGDGGDGGGGGGGD